MAKDKDHVYKFNKSEQEAFDGIAEETIEALRKVLDLENEILCDKFDKLTYYLRQPVCEGCEKAIFNKFLDVVMEGMYQNKPPIERINLKDIKLPLDPSSN